MPEWDGKNLLCYGDNLVFLSDRNLFPDACVDLIYLDPPFNSQASYNVLFKATAGTPSASTVPSPQRVRSRSAAEFPGNGSSCVPSFSATPVAVSRIVAGAPPAPKPVA